MTRKDPSACADVSPNLIPMIDIMFLLLLFFMLGADMGQREMEAVRPPLARSAESPPPGGGPPDRLTVNVCHAGDGCAAYGVSAVCRSAAHWRVKAFGRDFTAPGALGTLLQGQTDDRGAGTANRAVSIRADAAAPYGLVQGIVAACAQAGLHRMNCMARRSPDTR